MRQRENFLVLMDNYGTALKYAETSLNSAGTAMEKFGIYQESIEAKTNRLKTSLELLATKTLDSSLIKGIVDLTTSIINLINNIGGLIPVITALGIAFLIFKNQSFAIGVTTLANKVLGLKIAVDTTTKSVIALSIAEKATIAGVVVAGIIAIAGAYNFLAGRADKAKEAVSTLSGELKDLESNSSNIESLGTQYLELKVNEDNLNTEQLREYYDTQNKLKELMPELNGFVNEQGNFIIENVDSLTDLTSVQREFIKLKREELALASKENMGNTVSSLENERKKLSYYESLRNSKVSLGRSDSEIENVDKKIKETADKVKQYFNEMSDSVLNFTTGTEEWAKLTEDKANAVREVYSGLNAQAKENFAKQLEDNTFNAQQFIDILTRLYDESNKVTPAITTQKTEFVKLQEAYSSGSITLTEYTAQLKELNKENQAYKVEINDLAIVQEYLGGVLEKVTNNQSLSKDEVEQLCELYPELESAIYETADGWTVESDVLNLVNDDITNLKDAYVNAQNAMTSMNQEGTLKRINLTLEEINALQTQAELLNQINNQGKKIVGKPAPYKSDYRDNNIVKQAMDLQTGKAILYSDVQPIIDYMSAKKSIEEIQKRVSNNLNTSALKSESKKDKKDKKDKWLEAFQEEYDKLQYERDKDVISTQQYYDKLKSLNDKYFAGRAKYVEQFRQYDLELYNLQKQLAEKRIKDKEFEISLLEFSGGEDTLTKQIATYQQMQDEIHNLAEQARKRGLSENDEYIQQLRTQWMDYANNIATLESASFDNSNKDIDRNITQLELEQQLHKENSEEYITIENKKYDAILKRETLLQNEIARLQAIGTNSSKEQAESLIDAYYDTVSERYSIIESMQSAQIEKFQNQIEELEKQKSAIEDLHDFTMQMIEAELKAKKESIQSDIDGIEKVFNAKKQALKDEQDTRSYDKGLTEKTSVVADLENQLALIKNDETAIAKRKQLEQELADAKEDLTQYQYDHSIELAENALDKELEIQRSKLEEEIFELDDTLSNEVTMRELANKRIEKSGEKLKNQLIAHAKEYGTFTIEEVTNAWDIAGSAVDDFNLKQLDLLDTLKLVADKLKEVQADLKAVESQSVSDYASSIGASTSYKKSDAKKHAQMVANAKAWTSASNEKKLELESENQKLGKELGYTYDPQTGIWYKKNGMRAYHTGGIVGGNNYATKSTEELAKLLKGELVITPPQADKVMDMITNNSNSNINISMPIVIEGNADSDTVKSLEKQVGKIADTVIEKLTTARNNTGFKKKPKFV